MATITAAGSGSGIDVNGIVESLVAAERDPAVARFDYREAQIQAEISAFGSLKNSLSEFQSALSSLTSLSGFQVRDAKSSDSDVFIASATSDAVAARYDIDVQKLAQAHKLVSGNYADPSADVGSGTLTINVGSKSFDVAIANATNSRQLSAIRDAINEAPDNAGVTASILTVDDGAGGTVSKLMLTANNTGKDNEISITVADDDGNNTDASGLSALAFVKGATENLTELDAAQDSEITIDGFLAKSSSNTFSNAINGVSITLIKEDPGNIKALTVSNNTSSIQTKIEDFIEAFNTLSDTFDFFTDYDLEKKESAILTGDSTARLMESQLRRTLTDTVEGLSGGFTTLASIGITSNKEGKLELDSDTLNQALQSDPDIVGQIFASENGIAKKLDERLDQYIGSDGYIETRNDSFQKQIEDINEQRERLSLRLESLEKRYSAQFTQMDILVAQLQSTGNFLTEQLSITKSIITGKKS